MWIYEKKLQYPVNIRKPDPALAKFIISQVGGPDGELAASQRYLHQRYSMPDREAMATLTDIGTEELAHLEMVSTIIHQLTRDMDMDDIEKAGMHEYFVDHTAGVYPQAAAGFPFNALSFAVKGDVITDLHENMAAEQKARTTYDNILRMVDDPDVIDPIRFLRQREIVHFQRFGETLENVKDRMNSKNFYVINRSFDKDKGRDDDGNHGRDCGDDRDRGDDRGHGRDRDNDCGC